MIPFVLSICCFVLVVQLNPVASAFYLLRFLLLVHSLKLLSRNVFKLVLLLEMGFLGGLVFALFYRFFKASRK